jgi:hypothetical protein
MNVRNTSAVWKMYRTRFLVKARQLTTPLRFLDALGREQRGQVGDYLVEASDGSRSIQRRQIFEDIYVAMGTPDESVSQLKTSGGSQVPHLGLAAKRRQNKAHGASRGAEMESESAADERKNIRETDSPEGSFTSPRRSLPDHKGRLPNRPAATA